MDLLCPKCLEPWDNDTFHDVAAETGSTYAEIARRFRTEGCAVIPGESCGAIPDDEEFRTELAKVQVTYDMLGSDMDGAASTFMDFGIGG